MARLIILEGPDNGGKTTLGLKMAKALPMVMYLKSTCTRQLHPGLVDYHRNLLDIARWNIECGKTVVMDRFWPSEIVYACELQNTNHEYKDAASAFDKDIRAMNGLYVFCLDPQTLSGGVGKPDPMFKLNLRQLSKVYRLYSDLYEGMANTYPHVKKYVMGEHGKDDIELSKFISTCVMEGL